MSVIAGGAVPDLGGRVKALVTLYVNINGMTSTFTLTRSRHTHITDACNTGLLASAVEVVCTEPYHYFCYLTAVP